MKLKLERARSQNHVTEGPISTFVRTLAANYNKGLMASNKRAGVTFAGRGEQQTCLAWNRWWAGIWRWQAWSRQVAGGREMSVPLCLAGSAPCTQGSRTEEQVGGRQCLLQPQKIHSNLEQGRYPAGWGPAPFSPTSESRWWLRMTVF